MFETLRNFAEIGIAIAGFSAIASALSARLSGSWSEADRLAILSLLQTSAMVVFFALLPQVLNQVVNDERTLWVSSNLAYVSVHALHYIIGTKQLAPLRSAGVDLNPLGPSIGGILFVGGILLIGTQVGLSIFGDSAWLRFVYLVGLAWHSCVAGAMFGVLVLRSLRSDTA